MAINWTANQKLFCEYVIGTVESNCDYASVNLNDAITLGIIQWWGYNAAKLLTKLKEEHPDNFNMLSSRLKDALNAHPQSDTGFWSNFYCSNEDAQSWKNAAQDKANHAVQDHLFSDDYFDDGGNCSVLISWGVNIDNVKSSIFYLSAYNQSPKSCASVIRNIGGDRSIEDIRAAVLSDPVLRNYVNRYNTTYDLLAKWDGTSAPPDFGQATDDVPLNPDTDGSVDSSVGYIELVNGQDLIVHGNMNNGDKLLCHYNGNGTWYPTRNASAPDYPSGGGGEGDPKDFVGMKKLWEDSKEKFFYSQGPGRLNPSQSGYSDCSACIWWAANNVTENKYSWLGTSTYTMLTTCPEVYHSDDGSIDISKLKPGDLLIMNWANGVQHVDWYWGNNVAWGAGSSPLPKFVTDHVDTYYKGAVQWISVHRFLEGA